MQPIKISWKPEAVFVFFVLVFSAALLLIPDIYTSPYSSVEERYTGVVEDVDNSLIQQYGILKAGSQTLKVRILEGPHAGRVVEASNDLIGKMESDKMFKKDDRTFVVANTDGDDISQVVAYDHYRLGVEGFLLILFAVLLFAFTGWSGLRSMVSFGFALLLIMRVMLPCILRGYDPVWISLGVVSVISGATLFLVAGINRTALTAWIGALLGILLTATMSWLLFPAFRLHGAIQPFSETLLYSGFESLNLGRLFIAAIFLGASGAVVDIAIDVAASMHEVSEKRPDLSARELIRSGFTMGRSMVNTMVTTLLMAYVSGYIALLMVLLSKGVPVVHVLNLNYIAAEIMKTVIGSFGLVAVAPFTAFVGGFLFIKNRRLHDGKEKQREFLLPAQFKIEASGLGVRIGDTVSPDTAIGRDYETGEAIFAGCDGKVSGLAFSGGEHAFMVSVIPGSR